MMGGGKRGGKGEGDCSLKLHPCFETCSVHSETSSSARAPNEAAIS